MIEILFALIQFILEVVLQAAVSIPFDCTCRIRHRPEHSAFLISFVFLLVGAIVGAVSLYLLPAFFSAPALRIASLVLSPLVAGMLGYKIAQWQAKTRNPFLVPKFHFWYAFAFTLGLVAMRFIYAK